MENNKIKPKKDNFFTKIKSSILLFFSKESNKNEKNINQVVGNNEEEKKNVNEEIYQKEKQRIMQMYRNLKNGNISIYDIPNEDLTMIKEMMKKELELKEEKLDQIQTDINMSKKNIEYYKKEIDNFKKKNNNN